jgi:dCMP deaminase
MNDRMKDFYMNVAHQCSTLSRAVRLQVGCVIVKNNNIISFSWNGTPAGWDNNCEDKEWASGGGWLSPEEIEERWPYEGTYLDANGNIIQGRYRLVTKPEVLHAEMNAIGKLARSSENGEGSTIFITHSPCIECAKLIYQSGIKYVYYENDYRDRKGINFLSKSNIPVVQMKAEINTIVNSTDFKDNY